MFIHRFYILGQRLGLISLKLNRNTVQTHFFSNFQCRKAVFMLATSAGQGDQLHRAKQLVLRLPYIALKVIHTGIMLI